MLELTDRTPVRPEPSIRRSKAPRPLLGLSWLVVVPALIPIVYLIWVVVRPGGFDVGGFPASRLLELAANTAILTVTVTLTTMVLGVSTAWLTTRSALPGAGIWSTLVTIPLVIPSYVGAMKSEAKRS